MTSGMMRSLPLTCFLATFISLGVSLECEECVGMGHNCNGPKITCPPEKDSCAIIASEMLGQRTLVKTCLPSKACNLGLSSINMGKIGIQKNFISCCVGDGCKRSTDTMPDRNTTLNGRKCPACYAFKETCEETMTNCAGDELFCLEVSGTSSLGAIATPVVMKGCANSAACYELKDAKSTLGSLSMVYKAGCTDGASPGSPSEFWGFLFSTMSGLLLVKFLV
uniref:Phospholipase A2 inhibitor and Ly6/PLAUR domain-containing protein-like n=1 Tax=Pogona vitticeps TaxID=103695 RepID=A0A6J0VCU1_9SAUR|nr:phospholipase A2 inhibitor and Ly6/PLAUR domain-containing protein-like [Pogona vitticeps]